MMLISGFFYFFALQSVFSGFGLFINSSLASTTLWKVYKACLIEKINDDDFSPLSWRAGKDLD